MSVKKPTGDRGLLLKSNLVGIEHALDLFGVSRLRQRQPQKDPGFLRTQIVTRYHTEFLLPRRPYHLPRAITIGRDDHYPHIPGLS